MRGQREGQETLGEAYDEEPPNRRVQPTLLRFTSQAADAHVGRVV
jgi:hypothetical protein